MPAVLFTLKIFKVLYASIPYGGFIGDRSTLSHFQFPSGKGIQEKRDDQVRVTDSPFWNLINRSSFKSLSATCSLLEYPWKNKEGLWDSYKKYVRRDVGERRERHHIRQGASLEDVKRFYALYLSSMERNKTMAKYPLRWFEILHGVLTERGMGRFLLAKANQIDVAGVVVLYSTTSTHYFHNGSQAEFLKICPNELLIHHCLEEAVGKNHVWFDFMGSDSKDFFLDTIQRKMGESVRGYPHPHQECASRQSEVVGTGEEGCKLEIRKQVDEGDTMTKNNRGANPPSGEGLGENVDWGSRAHAGFLASGIDPADRKGHKNRYIDLLQKTALEEELELTGDEAVLDFGCGSGRLSYWIAPRVKKVVGLEVTPEMIDLCKTKPRRRKRGICALRREPFP